MKRILSSILLLFACLTAWGATLSESDAYKKLESIGFDNIKVHKEDNTLYVALEDNIYRGTYRGFGVALDALIERNEVSEGDKIILVALENQMPKVTITAMHSSETGWSINVAYGNEAEKHLRKSKVRNSSFGKIDVVFYPKITVANYLYTQAWEAAIDIAPALEIDLWKGAKATLQVAIPLWNNFKRDNSFDYIRPGFATLNQQLISNQWIEANLTAGIFSQNRNGVDLRATAHLNKNLDLGFIAGYTGGWYVDDGKYKFCQLDKLNLLFKADYYEQNSKVQVQLLAGKFVYGDMGARVDISRHLAEYNIGVYGSLAKDDKDAGFFLSIPIGPKKMPKHGVVRARLTESMSWQQNMFNHGTYLQKHLGVMYKTAPNQGVGDKYWQPEYIQEYVVKYLNGVVK